MLLLAVVVFRSFYGSSEPGMPLHDDTIPSNPLRPPFFFHDSVLRNALRARNGNDAGKARARGRRQRRGGSLRACLTNTASPKWRWIPGTTSALMWSAMSSTNGGRRPYSPTAFSRRSRRFNGLAPAHRFPPKRAIVHAKAISRGQPEYQDRRVARERRRPRRVPSPDNRAPTASSRPAEVPRP